MNLIKNYRVRQMEKYKIKVKRKYKKKHEADAKALRKEFYAETQKVVSRNDQKLFYDSVKDREYQLQDITKNAVNNFERGLRKIEEGFSVMLTAQDAINNYNQKQTIWMINIDL